MLFSKFAKIVEGSELQLVEDVPVKRYITDSRNLTGHPDEVFIASRGKRDAHAYLPEAIRKGTKNFIVEQNDDMLQGNVLKVANAVSAFQQIAQYHRQQHAIPTVAITGSNGKTIVKEYLATLLSQQLLVVKSPKSYNSQVGVPMSVLEMSSIHEMAVFEAGISQKGEMQKLAHVLQPSVGIFTNLGEAHSDGFSSLDEKLMEKLQLFKNSEQVICRSDTQYFPVLAKHLGPKIAAWSVSYQCPCRYKVKWKKGAILVDGTSYHIKWHSKVDAENLTHAIIGATYLGLDALTIQKGLDLVKTVPMRLELKKGINDCYLLDDTYNNDQVGLGVALDYLATHRQQEKRTVILSDILHSGKKPALLYREIADLLKQKGVARFVGVGPEVTAEASSFSALDASFFPTTEELIAHFPRFEKEMVLVKGARDFQLERVVQLLEEKSHGTVLEVNFEALQHNLSAYRSLLQPQTKLMAMVKANAYGNGIAEVANFLQHQRVDQLGVAYVDEAVQLRKNGIKIPIMIMNPHIERYDQFERYQLEAEIFSLTHLYRLLKDTTNPPPIHIKIDTGMHRLGFAEEEIDELLQVLSRHPEVEVRGIFTHFSSSDSPSQDHFTQEQAARYNRVVSKMANLLEHRPTLHACNSSGIVRWPAYHYDMVRLGIGLYGFDPTGMLSLQSVSQLKTIVSQVQTVGKGETVGYSRKGLLTRDSEIAVLPLGYEDGFLRVFGNGKASVMINGHRCPTVGNICMDMTMVDVTGLGVKEGDKVTVFGESPTIEELAQWAGTIPYEILTNISSRVKRVFVSE